MAMIKIDGNSYLGNLIRVHCKSAGTMFRWLGEMDGSSEEDWRLNTTFIELPSQNCYNSFKKVSEDPLHTLCPFR